VLHDWSVLSESNLGMKVSEARLVLGYPTPADERPYMLHIS
jgi:hypothetical protein